MEGETEELEKNVTARAEASGRADDAGDAVKVKLNIFTEHVMSVVEMFDKKAKKVSGGGSEGWGAGRGCEKGQENWPSR